MDKETKFVELNNCSRIWAIGSIHSNIKSFNSIKQFISKNFRDNDKIVFLGNVIGLGAHSKDTITSVVNLRFRLMSKFHLKPDSVVFLRGAQEEMFNKLLQLHTAPNPLEIINWMFEHGVDKTLYSYGYSNDQVKSVSTTGTVSISKWTSKLNNSLLDNLGHKEYFLNLKHAAYSSSKKILFVNRGVDIKRPLSAQNDCFWWGFQNFSKIDKPYSTFLKIVRGYQSMHDHKTQLLNDRVVCTLFKQPLSYRKILCGIFSENGEILDLFENN